MALLGEGLIAIWHNVAPAHRADYNHWHVFEHVPERVSIPGFLRGRRYVGYEGEAEPFFFHFYETETAAVMTSEAYLARLNDPTEWTRRVGPTIKDNNRTLSRVVASAGRGEGAAILTIRFASAPVREALRRAEPGREDALRAWLADGLMPDLVTRPGMVAAHLMRGDHSASAVQTAEKAMRDRPDAVADWVLFVEAIEPQVLRDLRDARSGALSDAAMSDRGAVGMEAGLYRFHYGLSKQDL